MKEAEQPWGIPRSPGKYPCPMHDDRSPSLSVFFGRDGLLWWKCHAGCGAGRVPDCPGGPPFPAPAPREASPPPPQEAFLRELRRYGSPPDWALQARRIEYHVAVRFDVRFDHCEKKWVWPVRDQEGKILALKWHREAGAPYRQKCGWLRVAPGPCGRSTLFPAPEDLSRRKLLVLVPGELKALRVFSAGHQAVSPTSGEAFRWPQQELARLQGFRCVLLPDPDEAGARFCEETRRRLTAAGIPIGITQAVGAG